MMRLTWATLVAFLMAATTYAQQAPTGGQPFAPDTPQAQKQLQELLLKWEAHSKGTQTLECNFTRWHYDNLAAPPNVHASRADGVIKYGAPDKGLFQVEHQVFYAGADPKTGKSIYQPQPGRHGEHWVCNGQQLVEFDREKKECRIQELPPQLQGTGIFNSPLPFVFNLDAQQIQQRYWIRQVPVQDGSVVVIEAWPKRQEDRAQYKLVQMALNVKDFSPRALIMYAPNFHPVTAPRKDHYEFKDVKRNSITVKFRSLFLNNFINARPPADWRILKDKFVPPVEPPLQQAANPAQPPVR